MGEWAVVNGLALRVTKINSCGLPQEGPAAYLVTEGFVSVRYAPVMREAQDQEQTNAAGRVCVKERTPAELKYYDMMVTLCNVNPELYSLVTGFPLILDHNDNPIGYDDKSLVDANYGVALETWTGGRSDDDCPVPTTDSIFSVGSSGKSYGYFLMGGTEWQQDGDITIENGVSTFGLRGRSVLMTQWGRGPWNVAGTDDDGTPGRMLTPMAANGVDGHRRLFRTPVPPPEVTDGAAALDITSKFVDPDFYFGGPANEPAADIAPDQDNPTTYSLSITGAPDSGTFSLLVTYADDSTLETGTIAYNASAANVKTALVALDDGFTASDWTTSGGALPGSAMVVTPPIGVTFAPEDNNLGGGTDPAVHVA